MLLRSPSPGSPHPPKLVILRKSLKFLERTYRNSVLLDGMLVLNMAFTHGFLSGEAECRRHLLPALPTPGDHALLWANWTLCLHRPLLVQMLGGTRHLKSKHITTRPDAQVRSPRTGEGGGKGAS